MFSGLWGKKLGMTELFVGNKVLPATAVDTSGWYVVQIKTEENDGYHAIKVGRLRKRYLGGKFDQQWLKKTKNFFEFVREIKLQNAPVDAKVGTEFDVLASVESGVKVDVVGVSAGKGFAGVIKRHNFSGGPASHGGKSTLRKSGSIGFMCSQGKVIKGKKMAGHMGATRKTIKNLKIVGMDKDSKVVFVKGAIPGRSGSLVYVRRCG